MKMETAKSKSKLSQQVAELNKQLKDFSTFITLKLKNFKSISIGEQISYPSVGLLGRRRLFPAGKVLHLQRAGLDMQRLPSNPPPLFPMSSCVAQLQCHLDVFFGATLFFLCSYSFSATFVYTSVPP